MNCNKCGTTLNEGVSRCGNCGAMQDGEKKDTITYDYKTVETSRKAAAEAVDCYENLGWELTNNAGGFSTLSTTLNFKRNRKIKNKEQLNRIQVRMDDAIEGIKVLEKGKTKTAVAAAIIIGIIGALMFGGGMSIFMAFGELLLWHYIAGSILGVAGMGVCGLGYLAYVKIRAKKTAEMNMLIDKKRDDISNLCEEAGRLLG